MNLLNKFNNIQIFLSVSICHMRALAQPPHLLPLTHPSLTHPNDLHMTPPLTHDPSSCTNPSLTHPNDLHMTPPLTHDPSSCTNPLPYTSTRLTHGLSSYTPLLLHIGELNACANLTPCTTTLPHTHTLTHPHTHTHTLTHPHTHTLYQFVSSSIY